MTLQEIYELALVMGIKADPRGVAGIKKFLDRNKKEYSELSAKKKKLFDLESLKNPYADSHILFGDPKTQIKRLMAGIDAEGAEILLADRLTEKGKKIDLVISHHPAGHALAALYEVMDVQIDMYREAGVPVNVAHALFEARKGYVKRRFSPLNHNQTVDTARLLNVPLLALHTIWDNMGNAFMKDYFAKKDCETVGELFEYINEIPEFKEAIKGKSGPAIVVGSEKSPTGRVMVSFTGGTNPSKESYAELAKAGVGTIIEMHVAEDVITEMKKHHMNVIDTGHMAADSIGANLFLDQLEKKGIEVIPCSGLIRVKRT